MKYFSSVRKYIGYGTSYYKMQEEKSVDFFEIMLEQNLTNNMTGVISTFVRHPQGYFFDRHSLHLLAADCDSTDALGLVIRSLRQTSNVYRYSIWESSPQHYWIITDYAAPLKKCFAVLENIRGVDRAWVQDCRNKKGGLCFRAFPKGGFIPRQLRVDEILSHAGACANEGYFNGFIREMETNWACPIVARIADMQIAAMQPKGTVPEEEQVDLAEVANISGPSRNSYRFLDLK